MESRIPTLIALVAWSELMWVLVLKVWSTADSGDTGRQVGQLATRFARYCPKAEKLVSGVRIERTTYRIQGGW